MLAINLRDPQSSGEPSPPSSPPFRLKSLHVSLGPSLFPLCVPPSSSESVRKFYGLLGPAEGGLSPLNQGPIPLLVSQQKHKQISCNTMAMKRSEHSGYSSRKYDFLQGVYLKFPQHLINYLFFYLL